MQRGIPVCAGIEYHIIVALIMIQVIIARETIVSNVVSTLTYLVGQEPELAIIDIVADLGIFMPVAVLGIREQRVQDFIPDPMMCNVALRRHLHHLHLLRHHHRLLIRHRQAYPVYRERLFLLRKLISLGVPLPIMSAFQDTSFFVMEL